MTPFKKILHILRNPYGWSQDEKRKVAITAANLIEENEQSNIEKLYYELLWAVTEKYPDETRHKTALRYIKEREMSTGTAVCCELMEGVK